jgi:hypothetical protein
MSTLGSPVPRRSDEAAVSWIGSLFTLKPEHFHPVEGAITLAIFLVPLLVLKALGHEELWLSFSFGALFTRQNYLAVDEAAASRIRWSVAFVLVGALLTALGYVLGGANWVLVVVAVFVTTFLSYLSSAYGRAVAGVLLNVWFLVALSTTFALDKSPAEAWPLAGPQALAWLAGGVFWLLIALAWWSARGELHAEPATPGQNPSAGRISRPLVTFSVLAALAVALATAVAWGLDLPNAVWMPVAAIVAMKPRVDASVYVAAQRVAGALVGALLSGILLTFVHDRTILVVLILVLGILAGALHDVNYALYCACISTLVLIALGLPHPGNLADNWERVVWTLAGVGIAILVTFLIDVARNRAPQATATRSAANSADPGRSGEPSRSS